MLWNLGENGAMTSNDTALARAVAPSDIARYRAAFASDVRLKVAQNAVTKNSVDEIALDRDVVMSIDHSMSHVLDKHEATNQKRSGRCWLFAGLNVLRSNAAARMNVKNFEFSQTWLHFWDKLERANYFLEAMLATADRDVDDRTVAHLLANPIDDGGQWNMFVALVRKYGVVPKAAMPETESSSNTGQMNRALRTVLRQGTRDLRALHTAGVGDDEIAERKDQVMAAVYRVLAIHLGTPPESFLWQWNDADGTFHRDGQLTPVEFAEKYLGADLEDYVCLVHDPRESSPQGRTFTVEFLGNVADAPPVTYLNVDIDLIRSLTAASIQDGEPVWFGCDTGKQAQRALGYWDAALYDYGSVYDVDFSLTKAERLLHHESLMTHAMVFTGVDLHDGVPRRWRVENSWGTDKADKGFWTMNDSWFGEHVFEVAVHRSRLPEELQQRLNEQPITLPAWDPMGALARGR
ncbi:bleomycin hydrolase [Bogoriella caseilytica]|uniref:Aminopeptidase n=2 Tax=Bogoriella caseilytica TaxID=56055 RepID=A0A3N2BA50_9MICO|nr:bleomycin hydrolase [Bogoriella caseilytica]